MDCIDDEEHEHRGEVEGDEENEPACAQDAPLVEIIFVENEINVNKLPRGPARKCANAQEMRKRPAPSSGVEAGGARCRSRTIPYISPLQVG